MPQHRQNPHHRNGRTPVKRSGNERSIPTQKRRRRKPSILPRAIFVFGSFAAMIALAVLIFGHQSLPSGDSIGTDSTTASTATPTATPDVAAAGAGVATPTADPTATPSPTQDPAILAEMLLAQEMLDDPLMILVSVDSIMPDGYVVNEVLADANTGKTLDAPAAAAYKQMAAAAANDQITIRLQSAYRSVSYQEGLFNKQIDKWIAKGYSEADARTQAATVVNPPGASEHGCGLAADINCPDFWALEEGFENTNAFAWLSDHAMEYGFILRYPKADEDTTGITYEPWHWRYVGAQNAAIIKESGLCLEDFLIELAAVANGTATTDTITGTVAFQAAVQDCISMNASNTQSTSTTDATEDMTYEEALKAGLDPEALGLTP